MDAAAEADSNRDFLTEAYQSGGLDVTEAADRGILTGADQPAERISTVAPDADGTVTYETPTGEKTTININDRAQQFSEEAQTLRENASKSARSVKRIRTAQVATKASGQAAVSAGRVGMRGGKAGVKTGKASGIVFAGAMTRSPYAAHQIGKRGGKHLIGPGNNPHSDDSTEDSDIDWSTQRDGPGQATDSPWDGDAGEESSETV